MARGKNARSNRGALEGINKRQQKRLGKLRSQADQTSIPAQLYCGGRRNVCIAVTAGRPINPKILLRSESNRAWANAFF